MDYTALSTGPVTNILFAIETGGCHCCFLPAKVHCCLNNSVRC